MARLVEAGVYEIWEDRDSDRPRVYLRPKDGEGRFNLACDYHIELPGTRVLGGPYGVSKMFTKSKAKRPDVQQENKASLYRSRFDTA